MPKEKIYKVAKDLNLSSEALVKVLRDLGYDVKSHMSSMDEPMRKKVEEKMAGDRAAIKKDIHQRKEAEDVKKTKPELLRPLAAGEEKIEEIVPVSIISRVATHLSGEKTFFRLRRKKIRKKPPSRNLDMNIVKQTIAKIGTGDRIPARKKVLRDTGTGEAAGVKIPVLEVSDFMSVAELAALIKQPATEIIKVCFGLGLMVTINQRLDFDTIATVVGEFGFEAKLLEEYMDKSLVPQAPAQPAALGTRPPVVTVMGHVDHGKTSLIDYIRKTRLTEKEVGGITQHIGAYVVDTKQGPITFLDTPGHEAFTAMRARGAKVTDLVILVVAADDGLMPQTVEAIDHIKAARVPLIIAVNKIDLPGAKPDEIKGQLAKHEILVEEWGGKVQFQPISCRTGAGIPDLLEKIHLEAQLLDLKSDRDCRAIGVILEATLDKGRGPVATVLVQKGTLRQGDPFITGQYHGNVRLMLDEFDRTVKEAGPSIPVKVLGLDGMPQSGDSFNVVEDEKVARELAAKRRQAQKERDVRSTRLTTMEDLQSKTQEIRLIIKGDMDGSVEALSSSLQQLSTEKVKVFVTHKSVGAIKESDVMLGVASRAIVIGFHIHPSPEIRKVAAQERVEIRTYRIIYEAIEDIKKAMEDQLAPQIKEVAGGRAEVRQTFHVSKIGTIAGCSVLEGTIKRNARARVLRDTVEILNTKVSSLRHLKDDVRQVEKGQECGITLANYQDIKAGDIIETYETVEVKDTL
jgi:translation initiation factor IF-2